MSLFVVARLTMLESRTVGPSRIIFVVLRATGISLASFPYERLGVWASEAKRQAGNRPSQIGVHTESVIAAAIVVIPVQMPPAEYERVAFSEAIVEKALQLPGEIRAGPEATDVTACQERPAL